MGDLPIGSNSAGSGHIAPDRVVAEAPKASPDKTAHPPAKAPVGQGNWAKQEVQTEYNRIESVVTELSSKLRFLKEVDKGVLPPTPANQAERDRDLAAVAAAGKTELGRAEILSAKSLMLRQEFEDAERAKPDTADAKQALHATAVANVAAAGAAARSWKGLANQHRDHSAMDEAIKESSSSADAELEDAKTAEVNTRPASTGP
jgi:hypothetical protein